MVFNLFITLTNSFACFVFLCFLFSMNFLCYEGAKVYNYLTNATLY